MIVTFEGLKGSGKTTQAKLFNEGFKKTYPQWNVLMTQEPGWNRGVSGIIKNLIEQGDTTPAQNLFLYLADRADHYDKMIRPFLSEGFGGYAGPKLVVCDRGPDTTVAYQGFGERLAPVPFMLEANRIAQIGYNIATTFYLDMSPEESAQRLEGTQQGNHEYFSRVREGYLEIAKAEPRRVIVIDANKEREAIRVEILEHITVLLNAR